jgi:hypothetical protein
MEIAVKGISNNMSDRIIKFSLFVQENLQDVDYCQFARIYSHGNYLCEYPFTTIKFNLILVQLGDKNKLNIFGSLDSLM